jgi:DNA-binding MarR family transcriptional regulator
MRPAPGPGAGDPDGPAERDEIVDVIDAVLRASRVLVSIAGRSLGGSTDEVTLAQFRALAVLSGEGPQKQGVFADALGVHSSTVTRMCDRLVAKGLVTREVPETNRREVVVALTAPGQRAVDAVMRARREAVTEIIESVPRAQRSSMVRGLRTFSDAAGEHADEEWSIGWVEG